MKKNFSLLLAALLLGSSQFSMDPKIENTVKEQVMGISYELGPVAVEKIRAQFEAGKYREFLSQLGGSQEGLKNLQGMRGEWAPPNWIDASKNLQREKASELKSIVADEESSILANKIRSMTTALTPEEEGAFSKLSALRHKAPGTGKNADENALIDLDLIYEQKALDLDRLHIGEKNSLLKRERHVALKMEMLQKMQEASQNFSDQELKGAVDLCTKSLDKKLSANWDAIDLHLLALKNKKPSSKLEEKTISILQKYQEKLKELT